MSDPNEGITLEPGEREDPVNVIHVARIEDARMIDSSAEQLPEDAFSSEPFVEKEAQDGGEPRPPEKLHPRLVEWIARRPADDTEQILITFVDPIQIPRFPSLRPNEPRDSEANRERSARAEEMVRAIQELRAQNYESLERELTDRYGARVLERYWLINGLLVEMPLGAVQEVAARDDVLYVSPRFAGEQPPANANPNDDIEDGRARIGSDPYFDLGLSGGSIGLLDTGLRFTHTLFNAPDHIGLHRDCVNGGADCNTGAGLNPKDDCWNHGTKTAAIITGNNTLGNAFRGVTAVTLDSFKVYSGTFSGGKCKEGGLDRAAAVRGFHAAVAALDQVIVAEMQGDGSYGSDICIAAAQAFDAGAVVIAANGNLGPKPSTVNEPANTRKVIGVGAFDVVTGNQITEQSRGPTSDLRFKPDIQAPTNTETASNASDTALGILPMTSGSAPYAAGAAALLKNWLSSAGPSNDPGQVYALLILAGQQPHPFDNTTGAGPLRLPPDGVMWWGKVDVGQSGHTIDIPLNLSGTTLNTLDAALWWPESIAQAHNDIDLFLIDPGGTERAKSDTGPSVFERARVSGSITSGQWSLRIHGSSVPTGMQVVYWAACALTL